MLYLLGRQVGMKLIARQGLKVSSGLLFGLQLRGVVRLDVSIDKNPDALFGLARKDINNRSLCGGVGFQEYNLPR